MTKTFSSQWPHRVQSWQLRTRTLRFGACPALMGIINVTPDSFSDGGHFRETSAAVDHGLRMVEEGAAVLDVGGESTRPYSTPVDPREELRRVIPVVEQLSRQTDVPVSIDTSKADVAAEALAAGAEIINDITGLEADPQMAQVALDSEAGVCVMHMQGTPQTMQNDPKYKDVTQEILAYLRKRRDALLETGVVPGRICLDPGIGFGKTHGHNLTLLAESGTFHELGCPLLVGASRKGYIAKVLGDQQTDRTAGTIGVCLALAQRGVQILRVHDVRPVAQALQLFQAVGGIGE